MTNYKSYGHIGISMGCALSMILSWSANHSIVWAILHGALSWIYVVYFTIKTWPAAL